jgi:hypothetical protein
MSPLGSPDDEAGSGKHAAVQMDSWNRRVPAGATNEKHLPQQERRNSSSSRRRSKKAAVEETAGK